MCIRRLNLLPLVIFAFLCACSSSNDTSEATVSQQQTSDDTDSGNTDVDDIPDDTDGIPDLLINIESLATAGCQNVVVINAFAYAACGDGIEIVELQTFSRNFISVAANDITGDANLGVLFTQSGNSLSQFSLADPGQPELVSTVETNFSIFSGVSAANGVLVVSGGSTNSDTEVYAYDATSLSLIRSGIAAVDNITGNPDVHVAAIPDGAVAFYSQDLGLVANWGIQIVEFDTNGNILAIPDVVVLTPGSFTGAFGPPIGPANFPLEGEFLNDRLYAAHFAANGIQVIDRSNADSLSLIPLGYEPTNIATDGSDLFVVSVDRATVDTINPITEMVVDSLELPLVQPIGIAANATHFAVADRQLGLVVIAR